MKPDISDLQNEARLRLLEPARALLVLEGELEVEASAEGDSDVPRLILRRLPVESVSWIARALYQRFPGSYVFEVLGCADTIEDHSYVVDLAIRCKEPSA